MRIFRNQQNLIETSPAIDAVTKLPRNDLLVEFKVLDLSDVLVTNSNVTLLSVGNGVYRATVPVLSTLESMDYNAEMIVTYNGAVVWYFKGPISAIIRSGF